MSGIPRDGMFGDKEIAVRIRDNSHYRISVCHANGQVGMLIALRYVRVSWATWGDCGNGTAMAGWQKQFSQYPHEGYFYFILLQKKKG